MMMRAIGISFTAALLAVSCSTVMTGSVDQGGSSSEVVAFTGNARNNDGSPAVNAVVRLRPADYLTGLPVSAAKRAANFLDGRTDNTGAFRFDSVAMGSYIIEIADLNSNGAVVKISADNGGEAVQVNPVTLKRVSVVTGTVITPSSSSWPVFAMVYGLERRVMVDASNRFMLNDLPEGEYVIRIQSMDSALGPCDVPDIALLPGSFRNIDTVFLQTFAGEDYTSWAVNKTISINTAASGAGLTQNVLNFPLLIRLDNSNFDFSASQSYLPGEDVRFANSSGKHLPYQVERWDAALQKAEIWVKVDTVYADDSSQSIKIYCGKANAASWSKGAIVFDTAAGFCAVWHLGASLNDATFNRNNGFSIKTALNDGAIGQCRLFDGLSSFIGIDSSSSLNMAGKNPTIMVWEQWAGGPYAAERMFFEHDVWSNTGDYGFSARASTRLSFDFPAADSEARSDGEPIGDGAWHFAAVSLDDPADSAVIYFDGAKVKTAPVRSSIGSSNGRSYIGSRGGTERFFKGSLDEIWILSRSQNAAFMKLAYENQRMDQKLVKFR